MQFSDGERLIAVMLAEVMQALKLDRELDPALIKSLVTNNDDWALKRKYPGLFSSQCPTEEVVSETSEILWMWGIIEHSIRQLKGAEAAEAKGWHWAKFGGFDANHDDHYGVALTMIEGLDEFEDLKSHGLNSHSQSSLPRYRQMYKKFDGHLSAGNAAPLSFEALRDLCG